MIKKIIITGAPCTGKSTVISTLSELSYFTSKEVARQVIKEQVAINSDKVPWLDNLGFSELVVKQQLQDHACATQNITFFDRGIPDVLAYMKFYQQNHLIYHFKEHAINTRYDTEVFILPPWKEVYAKDIERHETFKESLKIHEYLIQTYQEYGYNLTEVPLVKPAERVKFILDRCQ